MLACLSNLVVRCSFTIKKFTIIPILLRFSFPSGKDDPKAPTMHIKPKDPRSFVTPAPGAYNPESADRDVKPMAPRYSFGIKGKDEKPISIPGKGKTEKTTEI